MDDQLTLIDAQMELGLTRLDLAEIIGTTTARVDAWLAGTAVPGRHFHERLDELDELIDLVTEKMTPRAAKEWLSHPCPELDYHTPQDMLRRGQVYAVLRTVADMPVPLVLTRILERHRTHAQKA